MENTCISRTCCLSNTAEVTRKGSVSLLQSSIQIKCPFMPQSTLGLCSISPVLLSPLLS
ncbi:protein of unknown function [Nitrospira defluvii]|uniref:Uncharacterized protein n=1 Tax=Nitrospira defluvii TaxID=330214 RepID=D8PEL5_9BACT|nr:protein of unknown function [Nitrospira defluvii]